MRSWTSHSDWFPHSRPQPATCLVGSAVACLVAGAGAAGSYLLGGYACASGFALVASIYFGVGLLHLHDCIVAPARRTQHATAGHPDGARHNDTRALRELSRHGLLPDDRQETGRSAA